MPPAAPERPRSTQTQKHCLSGRRFSPQAGAARAGSARCSEGCRDGLRSFPIVSDRRSHVPPAADPRLLPLGARREPTSPLAASGSTPQARGALKHRWAPPSPARTARARARKSAARGPTAARAPPRYTTLPSARARRPWDCIIACAEGRG